MSREIPLFPLAGVVLLPGTLLPLHIFEPRYREMVEHALEGDRTIGMAMLQPGIASDEGRSPIYPMGGAGEIVGSEKLDDGRYNILLQGTFRYRILEETGSAVFRVARVEEVPSHGFAGPEEEARLPAAAVSLYGIVARSVELSPLPREEMSSERLASELALRLRYEPPELQAILEIDALAGRFGVMITRMMEWETRIEFLAPFRPPELDVTRN